MWNDEGVVGIPSRFEHSMLDVQRWESTFNQDSTVQAFAVILKGNVTHYKNKQLFVEIWIPISHAKHCNAHYIVVGLTL